jgi:glycosyltransferase involved in cell wall biosynthesis
MRIAWFTPFSGGSAVGEYSRRITDMLARSNDVELWLATSEDITKTELGVIDYGRVPDALESLSQYDVIVYNFGDHLPFYREIYEISRRHKGIVVLHDVVLHHFFAGYYLHVRKDPGLYVEKMEEFYGLEGRLVADESIAANRPQVWEQDHEVLKYPFFEEAIVNAEGVIVHSKTHASLVRERWLGPVRAIYHPTYCGENGAAIGTSSKVCASSDSRLLLLTVGCLNRNKQIHKVIEVLGTNRDIAKRTRYVVIGPYDGGSEYFKEIEGLIARYSLESTVQILGYQPDDILNQYLCDADIFINLRFPSMDCASWSLMEQLLIGKPIIVFETGFVAELPDECVVKVPSGDYHIMADRLRMMVANKAFRASIGASARKLAIQNFSVDAYIRSFVQFVEEVRSWRPRLSLIDRASRNLGRMGVDSRMGVVDVVASEICQIFGFSKDSS